jgi:hypothetical protein
LRLGFLLLRYAQDAGHENIANPGDNVLGDELCAWVLSSEDSRRKYQDNSHGKGLCKCRTDIMHLRAQSR